MDKNPALLNPRPGLNVGVQGPRGESRKKWRRRGQLGEEARAAEGRQHPTLALRRGCEVGVVWMVGTCAMDGDITESTVRSLLGYGTWNPTEDGVLPNCFYLGPITELTVRRAAVALRTLS